MALDLFVNSQDFFETKLRPVLARPKYWQIRVGYKLVVIDNDLKGHEYLLYRGPAIKEAIGFDPWYVRKSDMDDPERIADFFLAVGTGKLPLAACSYLMGQYTQYLIATGRHKGFPKMPGARGENFKHETEASVSPTAIMEKGFAEAVQQDKEVKDVVKKRDHDEQWQRKVIQESGRKHLLDQFGKEIK